MQCALTIDYAPAYELILSLAAFLEKQRWKTLDLGTRWGAEAEKQVGPDLQGALKDLREPELLKLLFALVHEAPGERDPEPFLDWLGTLSAGALYEHLHCHHVEGTEMNLPRDLSAWRDLVLHALRLWHEAYFRGFDPAIAAHLQADAEALRTRAATTPVLDLVAEATNGVLVEDESVERILLVPQYHMRPWNMGAKLRGTQVILYPVEVPQTNPDDPPVALTRLTRALSDENRLRILRYLSQAPLNLNELTERTGLAKSTVHHHMVMLRAAGLVIIHERDHDGRYALRPGWLEAVTGRLSAFVLAEPKVR